MDSFFAKLATNPDGVLCLDYDGTLAPFVEDRHRAFPYPGVREQIAGIQAAGSRVVIVSGRPAVEIPPLLQLDPCPEIWGGHGWERRRADGSLQRVELPAAPAKALARAWQAVEAAGLQARAERKDASVALHWRGLDAAAAAAVTAGVQETWETLADSGAVALLPFAAGLELRACGRDKGDVVREVIAAAPPDAAVAYLGDDHTDEDAFRALVDVGLPVLVSTEARPTAASWRLHPPQELLAFLKRWRQIVSGAPTAPQGG
jgi:trehalose-phosphatase